MAALSSPDGVVFSAVSPSLEDTLCSPFSIALTPFPPSCTTERESCTLTPDVVIDGPTRLLGPSFVSLCKAR